MNLENRITVAVIDGNSEKRKELQHLMFANPAISCSFFSDSSTALAHLESSPVHVIITEAKLPDADGASFIRNVRNGHPAIEILVLTIHDEEELIFETLKAGANGYLLHDHAKDGICDHIIDLVNGGSPLSPAVARKVVLSFHQEQDSSIPENAGLTPRENEILDLLSKGYRNKEIAEALFVSINTIRTHIYNIYEKLHVKSRVEALNKTGRVKRDN